MLHRLHVGVSNSVSKCKAVFRNMTGLWPDGKEGRPGIGWNCGPVLRSCNLAVEAIQVDKSFLQCCRESLKAAVSKEYNRINMYKTGLSRIAELNSYQLLHRSSPFITVIMNLMVGHDRSLRLVRMNTCGTESVRIVTRKDIQQVWEGGIESGRNDSGNRIQDQKLFAKFHLDHYNPIQYNSNRHLL